MASAETLLRCKMLPAPRGGGRIIAGQSRDARFQPSDAAAAHRHRIVVRSVHLDQFIVAGTLIADHAVDIDDMTAMDADEAAFVEAGLDVADSERAKQFVAAVEDISVMRIGVDRDHVIDGNEMRRAIALDRQMTGKAPRRRAGAAQRSVRATAE